MTGPQNLQIHQPVNIPSKPQSSGAASGRNQKDRRYMDTFWDIHRSARFPKGRPWCGPREIAANRDLVPVPHDGFCIPDLMQGEYILDENDAPDRAATLNATWSAPWRPLAKYFRFNYGRKLISFEYLKMRADELASLDEYYHAAAILGAELNVGVEYGVTPKFQITAKLGYPTKFLKIAEAAIAGDPWLLGHIDEPNPDLATLLGFNQRGMRMTSYIPEPAPIITPAQVIATPPNELMALLEKLTAQVAMLSEESAQRKAKGQQLRDGKAKRRQVPQNLAEKPAA